MLRGKLSKLIFKVVLQSQLDRWSICIINDRSSIVLHIWGMAKLTLYLASESNVSKGLKRKILKWNECNATECDSLKNFGMQKHINSNIQSFRFLDVTASQELFVFFRS